VPTLTLNEDAESKRRSSRTTRAGPSAPSVHARALTRCSAAERPTSGSLRPNDQIDVTVEYLKQRQHLVDGLPVVRLIEQAIQLRR